MKTKIVALLLLVVLACSLASCSFFDKIFGGKNPTPQSSTTTSINAPLHTEPPKVSTENPQPAQPDEWSGLVS